MQEIFNTAKQQFETIKSAAAKLKEPVRNPPNPVNAATNPTRKPKTRYITNAFILLVGYTIASLIISLKFISYSPFTALTSLYVAYME